MFCDVKSNNKEIKLLSCFTSGNNRTISVWLKNKERAKDLVWYTKVGYLMISCYAPVVSFLLDRLENVSKAYAIST